MNIGGLILAQVWTGSLLQGSGTLTIGASGVRVGSGRLVGGNAAIAIAGAYTQTGGIVTGIQNNFTFSGALSITKGATSAFSTFTSTGTIILDGGADQNFTVGANVIKSFRHLTLQNSGGGSIDDIIVNVSGGLSLSGSLTVTLGNLDLTTNSITFLTKGGITLANAAQATMTTNSNVTASGTILINDAATLAATAGTWTLNDDGDQDVDLDGQSLFNLTINNTGGGTNDDIVVVGGQLGLSGALTVTLGHLDMDTNALTLNVDGNVLLANSAQASLSGATMKLGSDLTVNSSAVFTHTSGTVTLDGTNQSLSGSITFDNLTKSVTSAATLTFSATTTQTIMNHLTLNGAASNLLSLRSSQTGTQWKINPQGIRTIFYVDVKDGNNTNTANIGCSSNCTDSGNNTNWFTSAAAASSSAATTSVGGGGGGTRRSFSTATSTTALTEEVDETGLPNVRGLLAVEIEGKLVIFTDVPVNQWFASFVWQVMKAGIASGYRDARGMLTGVYGSANPVTYAEIAKMALEAAKKDVSTVSGVPENRSARRQWAEDYIKLAEDIGLSVYEPSLDVNLPATRGAVIQTIVEALNLPLEEGTGGYKDLRAAHPNARAIATATALGIISGDTDMQGNPKGTVRPNSPINRAEVAKIMARVIELGL